MTPNNGFKKPEAKAFTQECVGKHIKEPFWNYFQKYVSAQRLKKTKCKKIEDICFFLIQDKTAVFYHPLLVVFLL